MAEEARIRVVLDTSTARKQMGGLRKSVTGSSGSSGVSKQKKTKLTPAEKEAQKEAEEKDRKRKNFIVGTAKTALAAGQGKLTAGMVAGRAMKAAKVAGPIAIAMGVAEAGARLLPLVDETVKKTLEIIPGLPDSLEKKIRAPLVAEIESIQNNLAAIRSTVTTLGTGMGLMSAQSILSEGGATTFDFGQAQKTAERMAAVKFAQSRISMAQSEAKARAFAQAAVSNARPIAGLATGTAKGAAAQFGQLQASGIHQGVFDMIKKIMSGQSPY